MVAKSIAPASDRNPPEIFCRSFIIRPSCSAKLLVKGTLGSVRKRSTSGLRSRNRSRRLWPTRRGGRPRRLAFSALLVIPAQIGQFLGTRVQDRLDQRLFRRWTLVLLILTGLNLMRRAVW